MPSPCHDHRGGAGSVSPNKHRFHGSVSPTNVKLLSSVNVKMTQQPASLCATKPEARNPKNYPVTPNSVSPPSPQPRQRQILVGAMVTTTAFFFSSAPLTPPHFSSSFLSKLKPLLYDHRSLHSNSLFKLRKVGSGICRAEFSHDAPFAAAIGVCMLSSLLLPNPSSSRSTEEGEEDGGGFSGLDSTDTRFAVMGIISFIPYFNWLSWVFAWLDSGKRRYAVYSLVYLAPYLRSNMSLSPEESWLPIASIVLGIIHVQLEISIRNGDIQGFQLFSEASKFLSSMTGKKDIDRNGHQGLSMEERKGHHRNLPSAKEKSGNEIRQWEVPRNSAGHHEHLNGDWDEDERRKQ